ncbi:MAG: MBL fold metallo-hydrolase [Bacteroidia bacterium]|nr:MBL fold metallo-hydrolase [Bacteroidia bacterium]
MRIRYPVSIFLLLPLMLLIVQCSDKEKVTDSLLVIKGTVNGALIEKNGKILSIYGDPSGKISNTDMVLFTHFRRDVIWAGEKLLEAGSKGIAPAGEKAYFISADSVIARLRESRFHDYYCQTTKFPDRPFKIDRFVRGGEVISWEGIELKVLPSPGYTRDAVSYITDTDGKRVAFTGDLIYGEGQLIDIYSMQDSYREIGGYHGYATRLGNLISSLQLIKAEKPDIIIPARGPVIYNPSSAIDELTERIRKIYANYLSISAYRWYFPERMTYLEEHVPGAGRKAEPMKYSEIIRNDPPSWYRHISNSNLVIADDSTAFLIDCGTKDAYEGVSDLLNSGRIKSVDGIFITHYHDDHTDLINDASERFRCPVYATEELKDILLNPGSYRLPCLTTRPVKNLTVKKDGEKMIWKDFEMSFFFFPGQTIYHDAVLFSKAGGESIFFVGDSFTPSGIDDYCLLNRHLVHEDEGFFYCLNILEKIPEGTLLANQHVEPPFAFSKQQLDFIKMKLRERNELFSELFPWDDINFGIDEQWAVAYPYVQNTRYGSIATINVKLTNHSGEQKTFYVRANQCEDLLCSDNNMSGKIEAGQTRSFIFNFDIKDKALPVAQMITFDVGSDGMEFKKFCEALLITEN